MATKKKAILHALSMSVLLMPSLVYGTSLCGELTGLGPDNCLISRSDTVGCDFLNSAVIAGPNKFGEYRTRYRCPDEPSTPRCQILASGQVVKAIPTFGSADLFMVASSPRDSDGNYISDRFVDYNIQCGAGRLAIVNLVEMNLEPKTCLNMCRDYVFSMNLQQNFISPDVCGTNTSVDLNPRLFDSIRIIFRSSPSNDFPGFRAVVTCIDPKYLDDTNCSDPTESARRKRNRNAFTEQVHRHHAKLMMRREKRSAGLQDDEVRFERSEVPPGAKVIFYESTVIVSGIQKIEGVDNLYSTGSVSSFTGPGSLNVMGRSAYFHKYSPIDFALSEEEKMAFEDLIEPQIERAREMETTDYEEVDVEKPIEKSPPAPFDDETVMMAWRYENSCSPVLRTAAWAIIEDTLEKDPERLIALIMKTQVAE